MRQTAPRRPVAMLLTLSGLLFAMVAVFLYITAL
jgi:hypothetical protein